MACRRHGSCGLVPTGSPLEQPAVQDDWDAFRRDMRGQSGRDAAVTGPVKRKEPKSAEPPLLVWLRDYMALAIVAWVLFGSVLFAFLGGASPRA